MREAAAPALGAVRSIAQMVCRVDMAFEKPSLLRRLSCRAPVKRTLTAGEPRF